MVAPPAPRPRASAPRRPSDDRCAVFEADPRRVASVRARLIPAQIAAALAATFRVLGDPTRVRILDAIADGELCVCDIATLVGLSESAVSHQLRVLRNMRLVRVRRQGRMVFYALDDQHILELFAQGLRHVQEDAGLRHAPSLRRLAAAATTVGLNGGGRRERV
jgi:ArsR family transcriptional regulator, lead/cadmium/zinc/bismuth-responsive transcriptional repressor